MESYPNNSFVARTNQGPTNQKPQSRKEMSDRLVKPVSANVKTKSFTRRFRESFVAGNFSTVVDYVIFDVIIPSAQNLFVDSLNAGAQGMIYGSNRRATNDKFGSSVNKTSYSSLYADKKRREETRGPRTPTNRFDFDQYVWDNREDAEQAMSNLLILLDEYGSVTVSDFFSQVNSGDRPYTDESWGWTNLAAAKVERSREGWYLSLPSPKALD